MTTFIGYTGGSGAISENMSKGLFRIYKTFDLAALKATLNEGTDFTTNDVLEAFEIPANTLVLSAHCKVHKAEGASCTIDIGDGVDPNGFLDDVNLNSTSTSVATGHTLGYGTDNGLGKLYTAADTVDILFNSSGSGVAVFTICLLCFDFAVSNYRA